MSAGDAADQQVRRGIEAILFLADEPVDVPALAEAVQADPDTVEQELALLVAAHDEQGRGTQVRAAAGGWRMYSSPAARTAVERWALAGRTGRLTQAALETLAVIAYKQPISRQQIGDIRGVNADAAVRSLVARGLVAEVGRDEGPGQAVHYGTTALLLERLGIDTLDELPPLTDFLPEAPAPDEPELGALKEVRRRLARGLESEAGAPSDAEQDEDALPPPAATGRREDAGIDQLTDRLEEAARGAVERLRAAVSVEAGDDEEQVIDLDAAEEDGQVGDGDAQSAEGAGPGPDDRG